MAKKREAVAVVMLTLVGVGVWGVMQTNFARDTLQAMGYQPSQAVREIEESLDLTETGKRIFRASRPSVEGRDAFNEHCDSHNREVQLLGCYTERKIYVYEIENPELAGANKVTMAHEVLHAAWERMGMGEKERLKELLIQVQHENSEWAREELASYPEERRIEEVYVRAGTKLAEVPAELEENYAKYFRERGKIVGYYESYQAPFKRIEAENKTLEKQIYNKKMEIVAEREEYLKKLEKLEAEVAEFNECAEKPGCFPSTAVFNWKRETLQAEQAKLEQERTALNQKIDENNQRVEKYQENQTALGELSDAMNSNAEKSV